MRPHQAHRPIGLLVAALVAMAFALVAASSAAALPPSHGQGLHLLSPRPRAQSKTQASLKTNQSTNWFGYDQGVLEPGKSQFHSITGEWIVPTASPHKKGEDESSSDWIGIGGGCVDVDSGCNVNDPSLIQAGTEQDVLANGKSGYFAWYELIPAPSQNINPRGFPVAPGDLMYSNISEGAPGSWTIVLKNLTRGTTFSINVTYTSTHATAEWIQEPPLVIANGTSGQATLPNLSRIAFYRTTTNGAPAGLTASEEMQLVTSDGSLFGDPSGPNDNAFNLCSWATTCPVPGSASPNESTIVQTRKVKISHGRAAIALVSPVAATETLTLRNSGHVLARSTFKLAGRQSKFVALGLGPKALQRLRHRGRLFVNATAVSTDILGATSSSKTKLTFKPGS
jgi:Peptidase A4 family